MNHALSVHFDVPMLVASQAGLNLDNISQDVKRLFAIFLYEHHRISFGKACEIGGMSPWEFFDMNRKLDIPIPYTAAELAQDMEKLRDV